jgi:hypothetical protein
MPFRLSARCSILLNPKTRFCFSPVLFFPRKRTARLSPAVQVREETPRGRAATAGGGGVAIAYLILQIQKALRIDESQFFADVSRGDRSYCYRSRRRDTDTLFQTECSDNPNRFRNKTTLRLRLHFSIEGGYPEIEYDRRAVGDSAQVKARMRNGVTFRSPCVRPKIAQSAAVRWPASRYLNRDRADRSIRASAANNDARQGVDDPLDIECCGTGTANRAGLEAPIVRKSWTQ